MVITKECPAASSACFAFIKLDSFINTWSVLKVDKAKIPIFALANGFAIESRIPTRSNGIGSVVSIEKEIHPCSRLSGSIHCEDIESKMMSFTMIEISEEVLVIENKTFVLVLFASNILCNVSVISASAG